MNNVFLSAAALGSKFGTAFTKCVIRGNFEQWLRTVHRIDLRPLENGRLLAALKHHDVLDCEQHWLRPMIDHAADSRRARLIKKKPRMRVMRPKASVKRRRPSKRHKKALASLASIVDAWVGMAF